MVVARLYEQFRCLLKMDNGFSKYLFSNMGVEQRCPLLPTLFYLCMDKVEEIINKTTKQEWLDGSELMWDLTFILVYTNDVELFSYNVDVMQHKVYWEHQINGLIFHVHKTKIMAIKAIQLINCSTKYKGKPIMWCNVSNILVLCPIHK